MDNTPASAPAPNIAPSQAFRALFGPAQLCERLLQELVTNFVFTGVSAATDPTQYYELLTTCFEKLGADHPAPSSNQAASYHLLAYSIPALKQARNITTHDVLHNYHKALVNAYRALESINLALETLHQDTKIAQEFLAALRACLTQEHKASNAGAAVIVPNVLEVQPENMKILPHAGQYWRIAAIKMHPARYLFNGRQVEVTTGQRQGQKGVFRRSAGHNAIIRFSNGEYGIGLDQVVRICN